MITKETYIATNRFGLGPNRMDLARASSAPKDWLRGQIAIGASRPAAFQNQPSSAALLQEIYKSRGLRDEVAKKAAQEIRRQGFYHALNMRLTNQVQTTTPFAERLVMFWSNHFTVSRTRALIGPAIPAYENEAIRPFIFGRFEDMLLKVVQHPCMLIYLDNISSIGPNSPQGKKRGKDLNENLAREILELHTMGAQGGYSQTDVTNFAKILTGWTVSRDRKNKNRQPSPAGEFWFNKRIHEPGLQVLLDKRFGQEGMEKGVAALKDIARHPSTANFIATKMVRHFIDDNPSKEDIQRIADVFLRTDGDLSAVSSALIDLETAWKMDNRKVKSPEEMIISSLRALHSGGNVDLPKRQLLFPALKSMGQEVFGAPSPAGWSDFGSAWIAPESLRLRLDWVREFSRYSSNKVRPLDILENTIAPAISMETERLIRGAPSKEDGLALILASPSFQRR